MTHEHEAHGNFQPQAHERFHGHVPHEGNAPAGPVEGSAEGAARNGRAFLTIRSHTGLSGDILLAGLFVLRCRLAGLRPDEAAAGAMLHDLAGEIMPELAGAARVGRREVNHVGGWHAAVDLPHAHEHRGLADIERIIGQGGMADGAKKRAIDCFRLLAACEGAVHGKAPEEVHFHEVGALDSILDICLVCSLYELLGLPEVVASPLPLADGQIECAHGILPSPAPAVLAMLPGISVRPFPLSFAGELVTPTAVALLHALKASFGPWPQFVVSATCLIYGERVFPGVPNGVIFALGA